MINFVNYIGLYTENFGKSAVGADEPAPIGFVDICRVNLLEILIGWLFAGLG
jgi:hypothetical protein